MSLKHRTLIRAAAFGIAAAPSALFSQSPARQPQFGVIVGVALDSIRGGYLKNAIVAVSGTNRTAVTDLAGRFTIDSVTPGEHTLRVRHALLDSIALVVATRPKVIGAGDTLAVIISTPGPASIVAAKCSEAARARGAAAVLGTVFDAETEDPSSGARVSTMWTELQVSAKSISRVPQVRSAQVSADGTFTLCGLPNDLRSGIAAARGADTTAAMTVDLSSGLAIVSLHLPRATAATASAPQPAVRSAEPTSRSAEGRAVVVGRITDVGNKPIAGAMVAIEEDRIATTTAADGTFRLPGAKFGTRSLSVRKLGYEPVRMIVDLKQGEQRDVNLKLANFVATLEPVTVTAVRERALERNGFTQRQRQGLGTFITPEALARRNTDHVNSLLRGVSFLRFSRQPDGTDVVTGRPNVAGGSGCVRYFVDGIPWASTEDSPDAFYHPSEIGAIEVYRPENAPREFVSFNPFGNGLCYVIVLWTKSGLELR
jgi:hypothetical protein